MASTRTKYGGDWPKRWKVINSKTTFGVEKTIYMSKIVEKVSKKYPKIFSIGDMHRHTSSTR